MSNQTPNKQTIQITSITLTAEDLAVVDQILGNIAHKVVDPIYQIIKKRMEEEAQRLIALEQSKGVSLRTVQEVAEAEVDA